MIAVVTHSVFIATDKSEMGSCRSGEGESVEVI
jgi:hypothetical protein